MAKRERDGGSFHRDVSSIAGNMLVLTVAFKYTLHGRSQNQRSPAHSGKQRHSIDKCRLQNSGIAVVWSTSDESTRVLKTMNCLSKVSVNLKVYDYVLHVLKFIWTI